MSALGDINKLVRNDTRKVPEYVVIFRLKISWSGNEFIGCVSFGKTIEKAIEEAHKWIGEFAFKKKHPIDGYEIVEVFRRTYGGCSVASTYHLFERL